jgi:hypothetical protein
MATKDMSTKKSMEKKPAQKTLKDGALLGEPARH